MGSGLRFDSLADMPEGMRKLATPKLIRASGAANPEACPVAGQSGSDRPKPQKYRNIEVEICKIRFKSKKEAARYVYLKRLLDRGVIRDLRLQQDFTLQEGYTTAQGERIRAIKYVTDFTYCVVNAGYDLAEQGVDYDDIEYWRSAISEGGPDVWIIEDAKSKPTRTPQYRMKYKMMAAAGYHIREV